MIMALASVRVDLTQPVNRGLIDLSTYIFTYPPIYLELLYPSHSYSLYAAFSFLGSSIRIWKVVTTPNHTP